MIILIEIYSFLDNGETRDIQREQGGVRYLQDPLRQPQDHWVLHWAYQGKVVHHLLQIILAHAEIHWVWERKELLLHLHLQPWKFAHQTGGILYTQQYEGNGSVLFIRQDSLYNRDIALQVVFKVADRNTEQTPRVKTPSSDLTFNSVKEKVINSKAKAVVAKWKEEKPVEKSYFYNRKHDSSNRAKESNMIKESQSSLDSQSIKDKMLSDEQSRFFYTNSRDLERNNMKSSNTGRQEESLLEKFSSGAVPILPVSFILVSVTTLLPFI